MKIRSGILQKNYTFISWYSDTLEIKLCFAERSHYNDKCENITDDIAIRKKILRKEKRCFKCLLNCHVKKCRANYKCFNCQGKNHHTAIYIRLKCIKSDAKETKIVTTNDDNKNDENVSMLVDVKTDVLLQIADCIISNPSETKIFKVKVLLDSDHQKPTSPILLGTSCSWILLASKMFKSKLLETRKDR